MNDEEAFQSRLDEQPDDHTCRLVFADWLQERGDVRAEGYRAMGKWRVSPLKISDSGWQLWCGYPRYSDLIEPFDDEFVRHRLPWEVSAPLNCTKHGHYHPTRQSADDAVAQVIATLPADVRVELLALETVS